MKKEAIKGVFRATRILRGGLQKISLAFAGLIYVGLVLTGVPIALYSFSAGDYMAGFRVLGILGVVVGVSAALARLDALDRSSQKLWEGDGTTAEDDLSDDSLRDRIYQEYVLEPRFNTVTYVSFGVGVVSLSLSFMPSIGAT